MSNYVSKPAKVVEDGVTFYTIREAARQRDISHETVRNWIKQGLLRTYNHPHYRRIIFVREDELLQVQAQRIEHDVPTGTMQEVQQRYA